MNEIIKFKKTIIAVFCLIYLFPFYYGQFENFEGWNTALFSNKIFAENLLKFEYTTWIHNIGFGVPFPLNPNQIFHPIIILFAFLNIDIVIFIFYFSHSFLGCLYLFYLARDLKIKKIIIYTCIITFLGCSTTADWVLLKFLPSEFFVWSMTPILLFYCNKILNIGEKNKIIRLSIIIGLMMGFVVLNSHPPFAINLFILLFIFLCFNYGNFFRIFKYLLLSFCIALLISLPKFYMIINEFLYFNMETDRSMLKRNAARILDNHDWLYISFPHSFLLKPLFLPNFKEQYLIFTSAGILDAIKSLNIKNFINGVLEGYFHRYIGAGIRDRDFFLGPPFVFTFIFIVFLYLFKKENIENLKKYTLLSIVFIIFMFFAPDLIIYLIGRDIFFRDGFFIFAILSIGIFLSYLSINKYKTLVNLILAFQILCIILVYIPIWFKNINTYRMFEEPDPDFSSYRQEWKLSNIKEIFIKNNLDLNGRVYFTKKAYEELPNKYAQSVYNTLAFHGLRQINNQSKGISQLPFYPTHQIMEGHIYGEDYLLHHPKTLSFLGIKYFFHDKLINSKNYKFIDKIISNNNTYYLFHNKEVLKESIIINPNTLDNVKKIKDCPNEKILCMNFDAVEILDNPKIKKITKNNGEIFVELNQSLDKGLIFISEMFRPQWKLLDDKNNKITNIFNGFIGVEINHPTKKIILKYEPIYLKYFIYLSFIITLINLLYIYKLKKEL